MNKRQNEKDYDFKKKIKRAKDLIDVKYYFILL